MVQSKHLRAEEEGEGEAGKAFTKLFQRKSLGMTGDKQGHYH